MHPTIDRLRQLDYLSPLDLHFARTMGSLAGENDPLVLLACALTSRYTANGHICVDLGEVAGHTVRTAEGKSIEKMKWPALEPWLRSIESSGLFSGGNNRTPLVADAGGRLYLFRYWDYQQRLVEALIQKMQTQAGDVDSEVLQNGLDRMFPLAPGLDTPDRQRLAAEISVRRQLVVISGGPGTGKTTTVVKIIALIIEQALAAGTSLPDIMLAAPTGKATARLKETLVQAKSKDAHMPLDCDPTVLRHIPEDAATIHRALGVQRRDPTRFHHNAHNPLPVDVMVVDECSMVDLALMTKLVEAVPHQARLILLGDKDQLASVEAGAVFGDICRTGPVPNGHASERHASGSADSPSGQRSIIQLTRNYRFAIGSGIGTLTRAINLGDSKTAISVLEDDGFEDTRLVEVEAPAQTIARAKGQALKYYAPLLNCREPIQGLRQLGVFRILCAHRTGPFGTETLNPVIASLLQSETGIDTTPRWYPGRPVMIVENDYQLQLFNGDVGLVGTAPDGPDRLQAFFADSENNIRGLAPTRLPRHQTVYAMTIHKSQGSEFDHVLVVLPDRRTPVVTRELLYTAVSRARKSVTLLAPKKVVREAIDTPVQRASGLTEQLRSRP